MIKGGAILLTACTAVLGGKVWIEKKKLVGEGPPLPDIWLAKPPSEPVPPVQLPSREELIKKTQENEFDVIVIGGGATGSGVAWDAQTRGLSTCLVEAGDFSSGTSSRSTKLVHGGVRYLEKAVKSLDRGQLSLVFEALHERGTMLQVAPHLARVEGIMIAADSWLRAAYFRAGSAMYDLLAGRSNLLPSRLMTRRETLLAFPLLRPEGVAGAVLYYDGQMNDARLNLAVVLSAIRAGAAALSHVRVERLLKDPAGQVRGVAVRDRLTGRQWEVRGRAVVNATGPLADAVRALDDPSAPPLIVPSSGTHVVLPSVFAPNGGVGLLLPNSSDGRVIFLLPWEGRAMAGTTDTPCAATSSPAPTQEDVDFILREVSSCLSIQIRPSDVLSVWTGIRPLCREQGAQGGTAQISREHLVTQSPSGLVTVAGGKWTTFRRMAQDVVDFLVASPALRGREGLRPCQTARLRLLGGEGWHPGLAAQLAQRHRLPEGEAAHLAGCYGDQAPAVLAVRARSAEMGERLHAAFPYSAAEVVHAAEREYARSVVDVLAHRTRLAFLDVSAARQAVPRVAGLLARTLRWDGATRAQMEQEAYDFLDRQMGHSLLAAARAQAPLP